MCTGGLQGPGLSHAGHTALRSNSYGDTPEQSTWGGGPALGGGGPASMCNEQAARARCFLSVSCARSCPPTCRGWRGWVGVGEQRRNVPPPPGDLQLPFSHRALAFPLAGWRGGSPGLLGPALLRPVPRAVGTPPPSQRRPARLRGVPAFSEIPQLVQGHPVGGRKPDQASGSGAHGALVLGWAPCTILSAGRRGGVG